MAFSDDEEDEVVPGAVTEYHFVDGKEEPACFSLLPLLWDEDEPPDDSQKAQMFLHGKSGDGLQKIYEQVVAWKVEIGCDSPEVSVLSKKKRWLKLLKPWTAYKDTIRKILVTLECLAYLKRNLAASEKSMWEHVRKVFSLFEVGASEDDLMDHLTFIQAVVKRDETLVKSQLLLKLLDDLPKGKIFNKDQMVQKADFINDSDDGEADYNDGDESEECVECFDTVCAICDNGGELLCCEGDCLRSFHATKGAGEDSDCKTLGYTRAQVHAIQNFYCPNCVHKKHQCFACGKLGNSNKESGAEVFRCISASCGHFYHPRCVAKLLHPENEEEAAALEERIPAGESFLCPIHKCIVCGLFENKEEKELQFAMCRRCPKSYHRKCLPRKIRFNDSDDEDVEQRAWDGLIPNRILIYCLKHEIDEDIGTPVRNHIKFPGTLESKVVHQKDSSKVKILAKRKSEDSSRAKGSEKLNKTFERAPSSEEAALRKKLKTSDTSKGVSKDITKKGSMEEKKSLRDVRLTSSALGSGPLKSVKKDALSMKVEGVVPSEGKPSPVSEIDSETKKRIMELVKRSPSSSLTVEDLLKKKQLPTTYAYCARQVGKTITQGKVQGSIEAIRAALQKFEKGCSIEDAKAVCGPDILNQILSWKKKFRVYLSPFLHGVRYSSYGRHFTKVDKLEEIVERLHWYVQNGDMIVDFCCGANDFSLLMKKKLEATGKKCLYKNYDLFQPKIDFNFERRDWHTVQPRELPNGSQLIMGLNPPFGVNAALANKFIDKALEFKPKLLILIVPKETERLDKKAAAYDLIWEDEEKLAGKAFYLPGSVDVNDHQIEQWNVKPPPLYLWSHPDWTTKHKAIALEHGHTSNVCTEPNLEANKEPPTPVYQEEYNHAGTHTEVPLDLPRKQNDRAAVSKGKDASPDVQAESTRLDDVERKDGHENAEHSYKGKSQAKLQKKSRKQISKRQEEMLADRTVDNASDMSMSPCETEPQRKFDSDSTRDARTDGLADLRGPHGSTPGFGTTYRGDWDSTLSKEDVDSSERKYASREDIDSLEWKYATSSYKSTFASSSLPNNVPGQLNYEVHGSSERFPGYMRDNPMPGFHPVPYISDERPIRTDVHTSLRMFGQQGLNDDRRGWHALNGASSVSVDVGSLSSPFGLSSSAYGLSHTSLGSSAMLKYAPRLDELNYAGPGHSTSIPLRRPGDNGLFEMPGSRPPYGPGSQNSFAHHGESGGWFHD